MIFAVAGAARKKLNRAALDLDALSTRRLTAYSSRPCLSANSRHTTHPPKGRANYDRLGPVHCESSIVIFCYANDQFSQELFDSQLKVRIGGALYFVNTSSSHNTTNISWSVCAAFSA